MLFQFILPKATLRGVAIQLGTPVYSLAATAAVQVYLQVVLQDYQTLTNTAVMAAISLKETEQTKMNTYSEDLFSEIEISERFLIDSTKVARGSKRYFMQATAESREGSNKPSALVTGSGNKLTVTQCFPPQQETNSYSTGEMV